MLSNELTLEEAIKIALLNNRNLRAVVERTTMEWSLDLATACQLVETRVGRLRLDTTLARRRRRCGSSCVPTAAFVAGTPCVGVIATK